MPLINYSVQKTAFGSGDDRLTLSLLLTLVGKQGLKEPLCVR